MAEEWNGGDLMDREWNAGVQTVAAGWNAATWATVRDRVWNAVAVVVTGKVCVWNGVNVQKV